MDHHFLNDSPCLSQGGFGLSSGAGLSSCGCGVEGQAVSGHTLRLMERLASRGGVWLAGGRRYTAAAVLAACVGVAGAPAAWGGTPIIDVNSNHPASGVSLGTAETHQSMNVYSGGTATSTTINDGGKQHISSTGLAISTDIGSGGSQYISSGGVGSETIIDSRGGVQVLAGGSSINTTQKKFGNISFDVGTSGDLKSSVITGSNTDTGTTFELQDGKASGFVLYKGASMGVSSGGVAISTTMVEGTAEQTVFSGGVASVTTISNGGVQHVSGGGLAISTRTSGGGNQEVLSGGVASKTQVQAYGTQTVSLGGTAIDTLVNGENARQTVDGTAILTTIGGEGVQTVQWGGVARYTSISGGSSLQTVYGTAISTTIGTSGTQSILVDVNPAHGCGVASATIISGQDATQTVNGSAISTSIYSGGLQSVEGDGVAISTSIFNGGAQNVFGSGSHSPSALYTVISSGGSQNVYCNPISGLRPGSGTAISTSIFDGGVQNVYDSAAVSATSIFHGGVQNVWNSGIASGTIISHGGVQNVSNSGVASGTIIYDGGLQYVYDSAALADGTEISSGGRQDVTNYGFASAATVYDGGVQHVYSGGSVSVTTVSEGGVLLAESGGRVLDVNGVAGILAGYGGVVSGAATIVSGGMLAPGYMYSSLGAGGSLTFSHGLTIESGGIYQVGAAGSAADCVSAGGTISLDGAAFRHVADGTGSGGEYKSGSWVVMSGNSPVQGTFATSDTTLAFFKPVLNYNNTNNAVELKFDQLSFTEGASTPNQQSVAAALDSLDTARPDNALTQKMLGLNKSAVPGVFDSLSGEMHVTLVSTLVLFDNSFVQQQLTRAGRKALAGAILSASAPAFAQAQALASLDAHAGEMRFANDFWAEAGYGRQSVDGDGNAGRSTLKGPEVSLGYDHVAPSGWLGGVAFRFGDTRMKVNSRLSEADIDSYAVGVHGGLQTAFGPGAARLILGGIYTRHEIDGKRHVDLGGSRQRLESDYHADSYQLFMEGAYAIPWGVVWVEPFVDVAWMSMHAARFSEKGGIAALRSPSFSQNNVSQLLGVRLTLPATCRLNLDAQAGWRHTYGSLDKTHAIGFVEGGGLFGIRGSKVNRDEAVLDLRAEYAVRENLRLGFEANAAAGDRGTSLRGGLFMALQW